MGHFNILYSVSWEHDFKNKKTTKPEFHQEIIVFLQNNLISTNRRGEINLLPIGQYKIFHQENKNILDEVLV